MTKFDKAIHYVLLAEGGYVDNPLDRGGPTNFGITRPTLAHFRDKTDVSDDDVKNLTLGEAAKIYRYFYWDILRLEDITSWKIAYMIMDQAINRGPFAAAKDAQSVLVNRYRSELVRVDGTLGIVTLSEISRLADHDFDFCMRFGMKCISSYAEIVTKNHEQIQFLQGWINRVHNGLIACWTEPTNLNARD